MARRNGFGMSDEEYEALRRKQNLKKVKASMKARLKRNPRWWSEALRATGYFHSDPISMIEAIESFSDESLRELTTTRRLRDIMKVFDREQVVEKRSEWEGYGRGNRRGALSGRNLPEDVQVIDLGVARNFTNDGSHINVVNVWGGSDANIYVNRLLSIAEYGENYNGWYSDSNSTAIPYINKTGRKLADIIVQARTKHTDEEIQKRAESFSDGRGHMGAEGLAELIEIMVLSIYDPVYRDWTKGTSNNYDSAIRAIKNILIW